MTEKIYGKLRSRQQQALTKANIYQGMVYIPSSCLRGTAIFDSIFIIIQIFCCCSNLDPSLCVVVRDKKLKHNNIVISDLISAM
jgi:hypothetical protein